MVRLRLFSSFKWCDSSKNPLNCAAAPSHVPENNLVPRMVLDWSPFRPSLRCGYISLLARINGFMHCEWTGGGCSLWRSRDCRLQPGIDASRSLFMVRSNSLFFPNWSHSCSQSCSTTPLFGLVLPIFFLLDPPFLPKSHLWSFSHVAFSFFLFLENFLSLKKKTLLFIYIFPTKLSSFIPMSVLLSCLESTLPKLLWSISMSVFYTFLSTPPTWKKTKKITH